MKKLSIITINYNNAEGLHNKLENNKQNIPTIYKKLSRLWGPRITIRILFL